MIKMCNINYWTLDPVAPPLVWYTVNPVYLTLLNFNVFLKTCVLTFIIITISQCVLVRKHIVPSDYYCQARISL